MAELFEIEQVLTCVIAQTVYPNGTAAASATGTPTRIYRGWPQPASLDNDLSAGTVNISVFPMDVERNLTKNGLDWIEVPQPPVYLTLTVDGSTVTVGGRVTCPLNAAILVNGVAYVYPLQAIDTLSSVATALAVLIGTASSSGPVVTIPGGGEIEAGTGTVGNTIQEVRRQIKSFRISIWCPKPSIRDTMAQVVDAALAAMDYITLPDGTAGRLRYVSTHSDDSGQKVMRYRRDFVYTVEYSTTNVTTAAEIVSATANVNQ